MSLHDAARAAGVTFAVDALPQDMYVTANGLRFHYLEWGDPSNPDVLLLHGFAQTCHSWDFVALSLCDRFHVVALDQRGHGDSDWAPDGDYTPDTQQEDLHAIVQAIGLKDFVLMGLSMGGRNSFTYAANHPEEIRALVIVDAAPETESPGTTRIRRFASQNDELESVDAFVQRVMAYNHRRDPEQVRGSILHNLKQLPNGNWTWKYDRRLRTRDRNIGPRPRDGQTPVGLRRNPALPHARRARRRERRRGAGHRQLHARANPQRPPRHRRTRRTPRPRRQPRRLRARRHALPRRSRLANYPSLTFRRV